MIAILAVNRYLGHSSALRGVQDKIDKLGAFRFQVKGWLVTLVTGFLLAGKAVGVPWWGYLPALMLIFSFALLEWHHREWAMAFLKRLGELERLLSALPPPDQYFGLKTPPSSKATPAAGRVVTPANLRRVVMLVMTFEDELNS